MTASAEYQNNELIPHWRRLYGGLRNSEKISQYCYYCSFGGDVRPYDYYLSFYIYIFLLAIGKVEELCLFGVFKIENKAYTAMSAPSLANTPYLEKEFSASNLNKTNTKSADSNNVYTILQYEVFTPNSRQTSTKKVEDKIFSLTFFY